MADDDSPLPKPGRRLALFFDGTWNTPESRTNVWELRQLLAESSADGLAQKAYYDEGVGTHWYDRISGGAFGVGLSANVRQGYRWLTENYRHGDEIFLFGFSRGAFTARSLAGFMARVGLLKPGAPLSVEQAFERYRKGDAVRPIYRLLYLQRKGESKFDSDEQALLQHAWYHRNLVKMVGVWDTVGSIGVPFGNIPGISRRTLRFHNTHLSRIVQHSYQALALDEQRKPYWAILWTQFVPDKTDSTEPSYSENRFIEQRWFAGAHANVGGSYRNDLLPRRPLAWMQGKAQACGLAFRSQVTPGDEDLGQKPRDSYAEFLGGLWKRLPFTKRYVRWVQSKPVKKPTGWVETVNERVDLSVFHRCQRDVNYRPASLVEWAERKGLQLEKIIAAPESQSQLSSPVSKPGIESSVKPAPPP